MRTKAQRSKKSSLAETLTRKARTLFSMAHSAALISKDGIDPRCMDHFERLKYLDLQPALNYKHGIVVYDIGAHEGEYASFLAKIPAVSAIYCFEPIPSVFAELVKNTHRLKSVRCFPVALGNQNGSFRMYANEFTASSSMLKVGPVHIEEAPFTANTHEEEIQMITLEKAVKRYKLPLPDFIKVDVQGYEDRVIRGGENVVNKAKFCVLELSLIPLYEKGVLVTEMNLLMRSLGFRLIGIVGKIVGKSGEILQLDGLYRNDGNPCAI